MTSAERDERLATLKRRLNITGDASDALLCDLLDEAEEFALDYTSRATFPPTSGGVLIELAATAYTRRGMEGQASHSEGGVSVSVDGLPAMIKARLDRLRVAKVG